MDNTQKSILIAEDDNNLRDMYAIIIADEGYQVSQAANGSEAWELLEKNNYDLLISDIYMPGMNGVELSILCREHFPETKIMLASGGGRDLTMQPGNGYVQLGELAVEVNEVIKKPFNLNEIILLIEKLLT